MIKRLMSILFSFSCLCSPVSKTNSHTHLDGNENVSLKENLKRANNSGVCDGNLNLDFDKDYYYEDLIPNSFFDLRKPGEISLRKEVNLKRLPQTSDLYSLYFVFDGNIKNGKPSSLQYYNPMSLDIELTTKSGTLKNWINIFTEDKNDSEDLQGMLDRLNSSFSNGQNGTKFNAHIVYDHDIDITQFKFTFNLTEDLVLSKFKFVYGSSMQNDFVKEAHLGVSKGKLISTAEHYDYVHFDCGTEGLTEIKGENIKLKFEYTEAATLSYIMQSFIAYDKETSQYLELKVLSNNGYFAMAPVGNYKIEIYTEDYYGNRSELNLNIEIVDTKGPKITLAEEFKYKYYDLNIKDLILADVNATDPSGVKEVDINFTEEELHEVGIHDIELSALDIYDNETIKNIKVNIVDDKAPLFEGYNSISISMNKPYLIEDILSDIKAIDEVDGSCQISVVKDDYHKDGNQRKIGQYEILLASVDRSHNLSYHSINVKVVDIDEPSIFMKSGYLMIEEGTELSNLDIAYSLQEHGFLPKDKQYVSAFRLEGFELNGENPIGQFKLRLQCNTIDGQFDIADLTVEVKPKKETTIKHEEESKYSSNWFIAFFQKMFDNIKKFFASIF